MDHKDYGTEGRLVIGGINMKYYYGNITYFDIISNDSWVVVFDQIIVQNISL